jgi:hypothetical protein
MQTLALLSRDLHGKGLVPDVPIVPTVQSLRYVHHGDGSFSDVQNVPVVEDVPEVMILSKGGGSGLHR